ncbi:HAD-IA family hydrolase [Leucobacter sp. gxy201]|uniref:HAD-IA family hydrolase n=1 Tax=Leucobacter sp. gxy201 TaxID=2957200 RepID=UPI003DA1247E
MTQRKPDGPGASARPTIALRADALLFDMDGTIADSVEAVERTWSAWAREFGVEAPDLARYHGRTAASIAASVLEDGYVEEALRRIEELESDPSLPCSPTPGALELISSLPADRWGVVTSAVRSVALSRLANAGFGVPPVFVNGEDVSRGKPDPEPFALGRERIGYLLREGTTVIAFEDTAVGLRSARGAGCLAIGIIGTEDISSLRAHADHIVSALTDVRVDSVDSDGVHLLIAPHGV